MKTKYSKILSIMLVFCMVFTLLPVGTAVFATPEEYEIWIGETRVTSENASDVLGDGTVSYDSAYGKLTFNGLNLDEATTTPCSGLSHYSAIVYINQDTEIVLEGTNAITATGEYTFGISGFRSSEITFSGEGSLTVNTAFRGIEAVSLIFNNGNIVANSTNSIPVIGQEGITVNGGNISAKGDEEYGIDCYADGIITINGGKVTAESLNTTAFGKPVIVTKGYTVKTEKEGTPTSKPADESEAVLEGSYYEIDTAHKHGDIEFTEWTEEPESCTIEEDINIVLGDDLELTDTLAIYGCTVNLCLNGKTLNMANMRIRLYDGAVLNIYDCNDVSGKITSESSFGTIGIYGGDVMLYNGIIENGSAYGIRCYSDATGSICLLGGKILSDKYNLYLYSGNGFNVYLANDVLLETKGSYDNLYLNKYDKVYATATADPASDAYTGGPIKINFSPSAGSVAVYNTEDTETFLYVYDLYELVAKEGNLVFKGVDIPVTYYDSDGETLITGEDFKATAEYDALLPVPEKDNYIFDGWFYKSSWMSEYSKDTILKITDYDESYELKARFVPEGIFDSPRHSTNEYGDVFLGGKYIEVGVSKSGSFGTEGGADPELHFHTGRVEYDCDFPESLGLVSDGDGWLNGEPAKIGDCFLPGTPAESWVVNYKIDDETYVHVGADRMDYTTSYFKSISTEDNSEECEDYDLCAKTTAVTNEDVTIIIETHFDVKDSYYTTDVNVINNSGGEITDVRFARVFDPDQDKWINDVYDTYNKVISNPNSSLIGSTENCAMVVARGYVSLEGIFFLSTDNRSRASEGLGFSSYNLYAEDMWMEDGEWANTPTDDIIAMSKSDKNGYVDADEAIGMTVNMGTIADGGNDSTSIITSLDGDVMKSLNDIKASLDNANVTSNSVKVEVAEGFYYRLVDEYGNPASGWELPSDGEINFVGLEADTKYVVEAVREDLYNEGTPEKEDIEEVGNVKTAKEEIVVSSSSSSRKIYLTVKFDTNGAGTIEPVKLLKNSRLEEPEAPVKEGYVFEGWYLANDLAKPFDFDTKIINSFTLYAKWSGEEEEEPVEDTAKKWNPFIDVSAEDWFYDVVKNAYMNDIMNGTTSNTFSPDAALTRGMFVTVLYRMENEPPAPKLNFNDVPSGMYYTEAIAWAKANEIVLGFYDTVYGPDVEITREQMAAILFRYARYKGLEYVTLADHLVGFDDSKEITEYAVSALNWAIGSNIMQGKLDNKLDPTGNATRAEAATVLINFLK